MQHHVYITYGQAEKNSDCSIHYAYGNELSIVERLPYLVLLSLTIYHEQHRAAKFRLQSADVFLCYVALILCLIL